MKSELASFSISSSNPPPSFLYFSFPLSLFSFLFFFVFFLQIFHLFFCSFLHRVLHLHLLPRPRFSSSFILLHSASLLTILPSFILPIVFHRSRPSYSSSSLLVLVLVLLPSSSSSSPPPLPLSPPPSLLSSVKTQTKNFSH